MYILSDFNSILFLYLYLRVTAIYKYVQPAKTALLLSCTNFCFTELFQISDDDNTESNVSLNEEDTRTAEDNKQDDFDQLVSMQ